MRDCWMIKIVIKVPFSEGEKKVRELIDKAQSGAIDFFSPEYLTVFLSEFGKLPLERQGAVAEDAESAKWLTPLFGH